MTEADDTKPTASTPSIETIPALFATIHFRSDDRPEGYTDKDIAELNEALNSDAGDAK